MQAQDIETYLADLGQELQNQGVRQPVCILMIGGAFMLTQIHNRPTTNDIDVLLKDIDDATTSPLYQTFRAAARIVATRNHLPNSWINDVIGDFLRDTSIVPEGVLWRTYAVLEVHIPPSEYILALKLLAGRQKDEEDIQTLCQLLRIRTRQQAQKLVDRYIPNRQVQQINDLDEKLDNLFP
ncbi:MAG: hypothetical protein JO125_14320 [Chloroflexi bacterium]|nr:hypothetical protein [Chloroflexota bacterium]